MFGFVTLPGELACCGTCLYWSGAREKDIHGGYTCIEKGEGYCKHSRHASMNMALRPLTRSVDGGGCEDWQGKGFLPPRKAASHVAALLKG